jgi:hypothetical protein
MLEMLYKGYPELAKSKTPKNFYDIINNQNNKYNFMFIQIYNNYNKLNINIQIATGPRPNANLYNIIFGARWIVSNHKNIWNIENYNYIIQ